MLSQYNIIYYSFVGDYECISWKCSIREVKEVLNQVCPESEVSPVLESSHTANRF